MSRLSRRLIGAALIWLVLALGLGGLGLSRLVADLMESEFRQRLDSLSLALAAALEPGRDGQLTVLRSLGDPRFEQIFSGWYWQVWDHGGASLRSRSLWDADLPHHQQDRPILFRTIVGPRGESLLFLERDLDLPLAVNPIHVVVAGDSAPLVQIMDRFRLILAVGIGLLGMVLVLAILIQVRWGLKPLRALQGQLDRVRQGAAARLPDPETAEIAPLVHALNGLLDHDADLIERARTHVGNLAHALKTPLAVLAAEPALSPLARDQIQRMTRQIDIGLARARAQAGTGRRLGGGVPVSDGAARVAEVLRYLHPQIQLHLDLSDSASFPGLAEDFEEILGNLLDNACKWARSAIWLSAHQDRDGLRIQVQDDGPGLTHDQMKAVAERGVRLDEQVPGFGLGLSIVSELVRLHGGHMNLSRSKRGGLMVSLHFPDWSL